MSNGVRWSRGFAVGSSVALASLALLALSAAPAAAQKGKAKGEAARYAQLDAFVAQAIKDFDIIAANFNDLLDKADDPEG